MATWKVSSVGLAHGQADTIDRYRAFVYRDVAALCHLLVKSIPESKVIASFRILYIDASGSLVHMSLNDIAIQPAVHHHTTLHIHFISHLQQAKIGTVPAFPSWPSRYRYSSVRLTTVRQTPL